ncbi:hypothetical protein HCA58_10135 [Micromonospora sp. HNM0581]|uniref:hypothetical protein n=1 Tax=Micromonospora sp. HNM0581 TaxID=2716341 RepID=UPI00146F173C|nr:hypothetical protein [Micromonospora sp. HNM0581]NLU78729.1 hypothetical protein [Micromonospora sp. HNM0581]
MTRLVTTVAGPYRNKTYVRLSGSWSTSTAAGRSRSQPLRLTAGVDPVDHPRSLVAGGGTVTA